MVRGLDEVRRGAASTVGPVPAPTHWEVPLKPPRTRRVQSGDVTIACQVVGDGPVDLVLVPGVVGHVERAWQEPRLAAFLRQLASFSRLVLFDPRGGGLSDRPARAPSLDERMADLRAVLDAVGCERAALLAVSEACAPALLFAATFPERTRAVILHGPRPRPDGAPPFAVATPGLAGDASLASWWSTAALAPAAATLDARELAPLVVAPALVLHRRGDRVAPLADGEALAAALGARLVALDGEEHLPFLGDRARVLDEVQRFVSAAPAPARGSGGRALGTLLAVTAPGGTIDGAARHEVAREVARRRGQELDREHHGAVLARFDSAGAAVACALALCASRPELAAGLGAGACRVDGSELDGPAAAAAALARRAAPGEVLATKLVRDLAAASGVDAAPRGDAFALRAPA
jgi:pimeloyl-ACP methyl ester carboxylesterase